MLGAKRKNRNIKGLQIADAPTPAPTTSGLPLEAKGHRAKASGSTISSQSSVSNSSDVSSLSVPSSALSASSSSRPNSYHSKLNEQLAALELGIEFKLDLKAEDLELVDELGSGNGGTVSRVRHIPTGAIMARKVVQIEAKPSVKKQIVRELQIMHDCSSIYIVSFYGAYLSDPQVCMCIEMMDKGSLDNIYKDNGPISTPILQRITHAVVSGLTYLYEVHHIMHRDVKPSNVLVNSAGQIKICDFGVSGELINSVADTFVGTSTYMSPERITGAPYTVKSDVWSLGITLIELALGHFPFAPEEESDQDDGDFDSTLSPVRPGNKAQSLADADAKRMERRSMSVTSSTIKAPKEEKKKKKQGNGVSLGGGGGGMSILELLQHVVNEPAPALPEGKYPQAMEEVVNSCLEKDVDKRPTPMQLLKSKWLLNMEEVDVEAWATSLR